MVMAISGYYLFFRAGGRRRRARAYRVPGSRLAVPARDRGRLRRCRDCCCCWCPACRGPASGARRCSSSPPTAGRRCGAPTRAPCRDPTSTLDESLPHSHAARGAVGRGRVGGAAVGAAGTAAASPTSTPPSLVADGEGLRHPMTVALPGRRGRGLLRDRLRLRRAVRRAHRPRRPVRRRGRVDVRLRRLPGAGQGGLPGHRPARGSQPRPVVVLGIRADVRGGRSSCASPAR